MSKTKRILLTVGLAAVLVDIVFVSVGFLGYYQGYRDFHIHWVLLFFLQLINAVALAALIYGIVKLVHLWRHSFATLLQDDAGAIAIEKSALVSMVRRALSCVDGCNTQSVQVDVARKNGVCQMYVTVFASAATRRSLLELAGEIQMAAKTVLESFTEREVRYVAVNFVEPRQRTKDVNGPALDSIRAAAAAQANAATDSSSPQQTTAASNASRSAEGTVNTGQTADGRNQAEVQEAPFRADQASVSPTGRSREDIEATPFRAAPAPSQDTGCASGSTEEAPEAQDASAGTGSEEKATFYQTVVEKPRSFWNSLTGRLGRKEATGFEDRPATVVEITDDELEPGHEPVATAAQDTETPESAAVPEAGTEQTNGPAEPVIQVPQGDTVIIEDSTDAGAADMPGNKE